MPSSSCWSSVSYFKCLQHYFSEFIFNWKWIKVHILLRRRNHDSNILFPINYQCQTNFVVQVFYGSKTNVTNDFELIVCISHIFSVRLLSVLCGHSVFSFPPQRPKTSDFEAFSIPDFIHYIYFSYLNSWDRASLFPFECSVLNKGTTGTIL